MNAAEPTTKLDIIRNNWNIGKVQRSHYTLIND